MVMFTNLLNNRKIRQDKSLRKFRKVNLTGACENVKMSPAKCFSDANGRVFHTREAVMKPGLRYFGKDGKEINREVWEKGIRDPKYSFVAFHAYGRCRVFTSWIGVQTSFDEAPCLFVTQVFDGTGQEEKEWEVWHHSPRTEEEAIEWHESQAKVLRLPLTAKKKRSA
jgi:hypothetical protein